jgi:hypothetical protein
MQDTYRMMGLAASYERLADHVERRETAVLDDGRARPALSRRQSDTSPEKR